MKKTFILFLFTSLTSLSAFAQWTATWNNTYQHTSATGFSNEGRYVVSDALGNSYVLADVTSNLDATNHPTPSTHYYVVLHKYDFTGALIGSAQIEVNNMSLSGFNYKSSFGLSIDASNFIYVGYSTYTSGTYDLCAAKYSSTLVQQWQKSLTGPGDQLGVDMVVFSGTVYCAYKSVSGTSATYALIKFDGSASIPYPFYIFDPNVDVVNAVTMNSGKGIYATGYRIVSGAKVVMTASVSTTGSLKWKTLDNNGTAAGDDYGNDLVIGSDGNLYVVGTIYNGAVNGNDGVVMRYLINTGTIQSHLSLSLGSVADIGAFIANGASGYVYASYSNNTKASVSKISINPLSIVQSANYISTTVAANTGITKTTINDMKVAPTTYNVYLTGNIEATSAAGNFTAAFLVKYGQNGFVYRVLNSQPPEGDFTFCYSGACLSLDPSHSNNILWLRSGWSTNTTHAAENVLMDGLSSGGALRTAEENNDLSNPISIVPGEIVYYPNPVSVTAGYVTIYSQNEILNVELFDLIGNRIATYINPVENKIDISRIKSGVYLARTVTEYGTKTTRIVID